MSTLLAAGALLAQTVITPPANKYTPAEDVTLGREAAQQVEQQLPILRDQTVAQLMATIGPRLVQAIPQEFQFEEFRYTFQVINVREINAFALPGGPTYLHRGMIEQARTQGEVASVMAHEISHVALRHGTAQATKATKYELGTMLGAIVGSIIGGKWGGVVAEGTELGLGTAFLRFGREYERQADLLGSHIMAAAGYDPREMASMFQTIQAQGGSGGPEWLSSHPDPGNRYEAITREAELLEVRNPVRDTRAFTNAQARLSELAPAPTAARQGEGALDPGRVEAPSTSYRTYTEDDQFRVSIPSNWREWPGSEAVTFAPEGAYGTAGGQSVMTHGIILGVARNDQRDVRAATEAFVASLASGNPNLGSAAGYSQATLGGRQWLRTTLSNRSDATNQDERIAVFTVLLDDGTLFYALGVAPRDRFSSYESTFRRIIGTITFAR